MNKVEKFITWATYAILAVGLIGALVLFGRLATAGDESDAGMMQLQGMPKTDPVFVLSHPPNATVNVFASFFARVPHISDAHVLLCWQIPGSAWQQCFYRHDTDGEVIVKQVPTSLTGV